MKEGRERREKKAIESRAVVNGERGRGWRNIKGGERTRGWVGW